MARASDTQGPSIRSARVDDASAIARVIATSWEAAYGEILPQVATARSVDADEHQVRMLLDAGPPGSGALVGEVDGVAVAVSLFGPPMSPTGPVRDRSIELYMLYAVPSTWGSDLGHRLFVATADAARASGASVLRAEVLSRNERARAFFARQGLDEMGERSQQWFGVDVTVIVLAGSL